MLELTIHPATLYVPRNMKILAFVDCVPIGLWASDLTPSSLDTYELPEAFL